MPCVPWHFKFFNFIVEKLVVNENLFVLLPLQTNQTMVTIDDVKLFLEQFNI